MAGYQGQLSYHPSPLFPDRWIFLLLPENTICPLPHVGWIPYLRQDDEHVEMLLSRLNVSHIVVSVWLGLSPAQTLPVEAETLLLQIFTRQHCCLSICEYWLSLTKSDYSEKNSVCLGLKFSSKSKLFGKGSSCLRTTSATLLISVSEAKIQITLLIMRRDALSNLHRLDWFCKFFRVRWQWQNRAGSRAFFLKGAIMAPHQAMRWIRNNSTMHSPPCLKLWAKISSMKLWLLWCFDKEQY